MILVRPSRGSVEAHVLYNAADEVAIHGQEEVLGTEIAVRPAHVGEEAQEHVKTPLVLGDQPFSENASNFRSERLLSRCRLNCHAQDA